MYTFVTMAYFKNIQPTMAMVLNGYRFHHRRDIMRKLIAIFLFLTTLTTTANAEYLVKLNTDITKFDVGDYLLGSWVLVDDISNLDVAYVQENYTYTACDFELDKPAVITNTDISHEDNIEPQNNVKIAIIDSASAITTNSSIKVNPFLFFI